MIGEVPSVEAHTSRSDRRLPLQHAEDVSARLLRADHRVARRPPLLRADHRVARRPPLLQADHRVARRPPLRHQTDRLMDDVAAAAARQNSI